LPAEGDMHFCAARGADLSRIQAGKERDESPDAAVFGG
jgi:hypothetical protein